MKCRLLALACAVFLLTACGQTPVPPAAPPTEAEVEQAYLAADEVYGWFYLSGLPTQGEAVHQDGLDFFPVAYDGLSTYGDLEEKVHSLFSPELADGLLSGGQYRDIGGRLYSADAARGQNLYLKDRTVAVSPSGESAWDVTLTFYADSYEIERPSVTIGYSQTVLHYENTPDGWRFTSFCPGDNLNLDADTVFRFTYDWEIFDATDFESYSSLQLALYLLHSDGAYSEWADDVFSRRFLTDTSGVMSALAIVSESPCENRNTVVSSPASAAVAWFPQELLPDFEATLAGYTPNDEAEKYVLQQLLDTYQERLSQENRSYNLADEFAFVPVGDRALYLGTQEGRFPWGYPLTVEPQPVEGSDFGQGYNADCGSFQAHYTTTSDGTDWLTRLSTTLPYTEPGCVSTPRGVYCGSTLKHVLHAYPKAVPLEAEGYDSMYVYEPDCCIHIAFYIISEMTLF